MARHERAAARRPTGQHAPRHARRVRRAGAGRGARRTRPTGSRPRGSSSSAARWDGGPPSPRAPSRCRTRRPCSWRVSSIRGRASWWPTRARRPAPRRRTWPSSWAIAAASSPSIRRRRGSSWSAWPRRGSASPSSRPAWGRGRRSRGAGGASAIASSSTRPARTSGVLRRNPDVKWRRTEDDLGRLQEKQRTILEAAAAMVKPGGRLVYATCSLEPEENEAVVGSLSRLRNELAAGSAGRASPCRPTRQGFVRLYPHVHGTDGFTAIRLRRAT